MRPCRICGHHILMNHSVCTHCEPTTSTTISKSSALALGVLLGLGAVGCGEKDEDTSMTDSAVEEPASEPDMAAEYGVPSVESE